MAETKNEAWRVFCAIELPSLVHQKISEHIRRLRDAAPDSPASWSRADNIHLTLKFVGEISADRVSDLSQAAANAVEGFSSFEIGIGDTGSFPKHGTPRVLWIGVSDHTERLAQLQTKLENECLRLGFEREARTFNPHLTIARIRKPQGTRALAAAHKEMDFASTKVCVSELTLIRSELSSQGSNYTVLSRHALSDKL
ncbi:MAG TPA: RNA 2',3'-cyclic phosphodiesterase [Pyrinomonadaceae bacterium]|nr:RNA 2',3'-cyclic phosphodiesterase [Pyrinomonadaceae bacterium]